MRPAKLSRHWRAPSSSSALSQSASSLNDTDTSAVHVESADANTVIDIDELTPATSAVSSPLNNSRHKKRASKSADIIDGVGGAVTPPKRKARPVLSPLSPALVTLPTSLAATPIIPLKAVTPTATRAIPTTRIREDDAEQFLVGADTYIGRNVEKDRTNKVKRIRSYERRSNGRPAVSAILRVAYTAVVLLTAVLFVSVGVFLLYPERSVPISAGCAAPYVWSACAVGLIDVERIKSRLHDLTSYPTLAGTDGSFQAAQYVADQFRSYGLTTDIERYDVLLAFPISTYVAQVDRNGSVIYTAALKEPPIDVDPTSADARAVMTYNAYGASKDVTAELFYCNYCAA